MKNLMLQESLLKAAAENLNGEEFKDLILKLNDYFLNGVVPELNGISKMLFDINKPYFDYLSAKYEERTNEKIGFERIN